MNSNLTMTQTTNEAGFESTAVDLVNARISKAGCGNWKDVTLDVTVSDKVKILATGIADILSVKNPMAPVSDSVIEAFLTNLVKLRVLQIERKLPRSITSRDVPVPDFFRPFLMRLGKFEDGLRALEIHLTVAESSEKAEEGKNAEGMISGVPTMDELNQAARLLKARGVRITLGLPGELSTPSDAIFRIREDSDGSLYVAGADVTEVDLLVRSIVRIEFSQEIFGAARTRYLGVEDLRPALEAIASLAVS